MSDERKKQNWPVAPSRSAAPPSVNYVQEVRSDDPPPSCHVCGAVMVPTRFNCRSCGATTEPTEAAPPSEREAFDEEVLKALRGAQDTIQWAIDRLKFDMGIRKIEARAAVRSNSELQAMLDKYAETERILRKRVEELESAAVPKDRAIIEQQAAYYFSEIRKFSPLNLDRYSLENWKDFIVWREARAAVPQAPQSDAIAELRSFLTDMRRDADDSNDQGLADYVSEIVQFVSAIERAAAVPAPGRGQFLSIEIEQGQLVIRIGVDALVEAAESSQEFRPFNQEANGFDQWKVRDADEFAKEVANALHDEEEDGSTDITKALDAACLKALESGCKADLVKAVAGATAPPKEAE